MAWSSDTAATQLTSITTEQFFDVSPTFSPGEWAHVQVSVDWPAAPVDDIFIACYSTLDDSSEVWDLVPLFQIRLSRLVDPNIISFIVREVYRFRVGVRRTGTTTTITSADLSYRTNGISL